MSYQHLFSNTEPFWEHNIGMTDLDLTQHSNLVTLLYIMNNSACFTFSNWRNMLSWNKGTDLMPKMDFYGLQIQPKLVLLS